MNDDAIKDKQKRVRSKLKKLNNIFKELPDDRKVAVKDLIQNCAFIVVELEDLQAMIQQYGAVEKYQNGQNQWGMKPSSAVQVYNNLLKSYNTSIKLLLGELPETEKKESKNELADFLMGSK
jgi:hypothetical protein